MSEVKEFYVYELVDPRDGSTFYVGKGMGERANQHVLEARNEGIETEKALRIRDVERASLKVGVRVIGRYSTEAQALSVEATLIHWVYGLSNLTNIQGGHGGSSIRNHGEHGEIEGLDVPKAIKQPDGVYSQAMRMARETNRIVEFLSEVVGWLSDELDIPFSSVDTSESNKTKAYVYFENVRIRIGAFHSKEPSLWLALEPSDPKRLDAYHQFVEDIGWELRKSKRIARLPKYRGTKDLSLLRDQIRDLLIQIRAHGMRLIE